MHLSYGNTTCLVFKRGIQSKNFENWCSGELSKIGHHFSNKVIYKLTLSRNVNNKKCAPKLVLFNEKKIEKDTDDF